MMSVVVQQGMLAVRHRGLGELGALKQTLVVPAVFPASLPWCVCVDK